MFNYELQLQDVSPTYMSIKQTVIKVFVSFGYIKILIMLVMQVSQTDVKIFFETRCGEVSQFFI